MDHATVVRHFKPDGVINGRDARLLVRIVISHCHCNCAGFVGRVSLQRPARSEHRSINGCECLVPRVEPTPKIDSTTNKVVLTSEVSGTKTRRDSATSVIAHKSNRTITGLAAGSTQRTVAGTSVGTETTTGTTDAGAFQAIRTVNDTTTGIIIPLVSGKPTFPSAGRVSRNMGAAVTVAGATTTHKRSEVVTYDGSATASVVITQDGKTKNCKLPLPRGRLVCN